MEQVDQDRGNSTECIETRLRFLVMFVWRLLYFCGESAVSSKSIMTRRINAAAYIQG